METLRFVKPVIAVCVAALVLLLPGCVEHRLHYRFNVDGTCDFTSTARGDSSDIYAPTGTFPEEPFFQIETWTDTDSTGSTTYYLQASNRFAADSLPVNLGLREVPWSNVLLQHPTNLKRTMLFFLDIFDLQLVFQNRHRTAVDGDRWEYIPPECKILETDADSTLSPEDRTILEEKYAAGLLLWNVGRYKLRFHEIADRALALNPEIQLPPGWVDTAMVEIEAMLEFYADTITIEDLDYADLEWWEVLSSEGNRILLENLNMIGDSTLPADIRQVSELLELRHQVDLDLEDDSYDVSVELPGWILHSNADTTEAGVLTWEMYGEDLQEEDYVIEARSLFVYRDRVVGALVLIFALLIGLWFKKKQAKRERGSLNQP
ncbi:MAG: hypothetical protein ABH878_00945 [bacterium]